MKKKNHVFTKDYMMAVRTPMQLIDSVYLVFLWVLSILSRFCVAMYPGTGYGCKLLVIELYLTLLKPSYVLYGKMCS